MGARSKFLQKLRLIGVYLSRICSLASKADSIGHSCIITQFYGCSLRKQCVRRMSRGKLAVGVLVFGVFGAVGATAYPVLVSPPARPGKHALPGGDRAGAKAGGFDRPSMWKSVDRTVKGTDT